LLEGLARHGGSGFPEPIAKLETASVATEGNL
jgi:hypothetical protein